MGLDEYEGFFYQACHADEDTLDPVGYWQGVEQNQKQIIEHVQGHDQVLLRGPNVDLSLSIKERVFENAAGEHNMPDNLINILVQHYKLKISLSIVVDSAFISH